MDGEHIVDYCVKKGIKFIAFTYNEPTISHEYWRSVTAAAAPKNIKCVYVSNGYMSAETRAELVQWVSAFNIDLKGFSDETYRRVLGGRL